MINFVDTHLKWWPFCSLYIIIEKQITTKCNIMRTNIIFDKYILRFSEHVYFF